VTEITDDARGRRNDRHFEIMLINASAKKLTEQVSPSSFHCKSLDGKLHVEAGPTTAWSPIRAFFGAVWRSLLLTRNTGNVSNFGKRL
jgi:hypothetical protein